MTVYSSDREVLQQAMLWLQQDLQVILVTVAKTWGSSPRPPGSLMAMNENGLHVGSVSGGCVEQDLVNAYCSGQLSEAREGIANNQDNEHFPTRINYGVNRQEALRYGLPCGGRLELLLEKLDSSAMLKPILECVEKGESLARRVCLNTGEVSLHKNKRYQDFSYDDDALIKVFGPQWHLLLVGAGQLARYIASIALMLDYRITICDPREEYQATWQCEGSEFSKLMPDEAVELLSNPQRGILVTLAHDPKLDDMALMQALTLDLFFVGALGSRRSHEQRRQRLLSLGITQAQLDKLHAPVGLDIGSHTPAEIAVSIMAQLTAQRNARVVASLSSAT